MPICHYCGGQANTKDHKIPKAKGGGNEKENLLDACYPCNNLKSDDDYEVFVKFFDGNVPKYQWPLRARNFKRLRKIVSEMKLYKTLFGVVTSDLDLMKGAELTNNKIFRIINGKIK